MDLLEAKALAETAKVDHTPEAMAHAGLKDAQLRRAKAFAADPNHPDIKQHDADIEKWKQHYANEVNGKAAIEKQTANDQHELAKTSAEAEANIKNAHAKVLNAASKHVGTAIKTHGINGLLNAGQNNAETDKGEETKKK